MEERRKNNRIKLTSSLFIKRLDRDTQEKVEIEILDVSKSGVGFSCSKPLEIGAVYESHLRIWTQEVLHAFLEIVRILRRLRMGLLMEQSLLECRSWRHPESSFMILSII